jgi:hypothetical protein
MDTSTIPTPSSTPFPPGPVPPGPVPPADLPSEHLEALICAGAANLAAAEFEWLLAVAEFDRRRSWEEWSLPSCAHWLSWQVSLDLDLRAGT